MKVKPEPWQQYSPKQNTLMMKSNMTEPLPRKATTPESEEDAHGGPAAAAAEKGGMKKKRKRGGRIDGKPAFQHLGRKARGGKCLPKHGNAVEKERGAIDSGDNPDLEGLGRNFRAMGGRNLPKHGNAPNRGDVHSIKTGDNPPFKHMAKQPAMDYPKVGHIKYHAKTMDRFKANENPDWVGKMRSSKAKGGGTGDKGDEVEKKDMSANDKPVKGFDEDTGKKVSPDHRAAKGGRISRADGGRTVKGKGGTKVNIIVMPQGGGQPGGAAVMPPRPAMPPPAPPPRPPMPPGGMPPGGMPPGGVMPVGVPMGGGAPPPGAGPAPGMPMRASGGAVHKYPEMHYAGCGGLGRLEKIQKYGKNSEP
jgi:hypothetical protein